MQYKLIITTCNPSTCIFIFLLHFAAYWAVVSLMSVLQHHVSVFVLVYKKIHCYVLSMTEHLPINVHLQVL